jgi:hypothetical protein
MNEREKAGGQFVVTSGDAPKVLEFAEPVFDLVPTPVESPRVLGGPPTDFDPRNHARDVVAGQAFADGIGVVGTVGGETAERAGRMHLGIDRVKGDAVVSLSGRQRECDRPMFVGARGVHFGSQSAARASKSLIWTVFFGAPAACGWAGMLVLSTNTSNSSGDEPREICSHNRCQTLAFSQRRNRMYTVLHAPNSGGRSRHGKPVRAKYSTASRNSRSSMPGGAPRGSFTSANASVSCSHIALLRSLRAILS